MEHCALDGRPVGHTRDVPVQQRDVILHHHMDPRDIETLLEAAQARANPIGKHIVGDRWIGPSARQPINQPLEASARIPDPPPEHVDTTS